MFEWKKEKCVNCGHCMPTNLLGGKCMKKTTDPRYAPDVMLNVYSCSKGNSRNSLDATVKLR